MKNNNNISLIIFVIFVVTIISIATFFIYQSNSKKANENQGNKTIQENVAIVDNLKMGISEYDTMNPI